MQMGIPLPTGDYNLVSWGQRLVAKISATGQPGYRIYLPSNDAPRTYQRARIARNRRSDSAAVETVRLENGKPRYGADITERYLSQETNQMHALSFSKGCYLGQEIVERVRSRAQIHRMLSPVRIEAHSPPPPRTKLRVDEKDVGEITSSAFSPAYNQVVALGYVRVEQIQARNEMMLAGSEPESELTYPDSRYFSSRSRSSNSRGTLTLPSTPLPKCTFGFALPWKSEPPVGRSAHSSAKAW